MIMRLLYDGQNCLGIEKYRMSNLAVQRVSVPPGSLLQSLLQEGIK